MAKVSDSFYDNDDKQLSDFLNKLLISLVMKIPGKPVRDVANESCYCN